MTFLRYAELTQDTFPVDEGVVAVLPLSAVETHGPHLPLGTDAIIAEGILDHAETLDGGTETAILRLPLLWLGASVEHAERAGTLSTEPEALIARIVDIGKGLAHAGVRRVLLFNGHGGNVAPASIAALRLRTRFDLLAGSVHWLDLGLPDGIAAPAPVEEDVHGGWIETSIMLCLAPHLVRQDLVSARLPGTPAPCLFPKGPVSWGWKADDLAPGGWIGHPDLACVETGRSLVEHAAVRLLSVLQEMACATWP